MSAIASSIIDLWSVNATVTLKRTTSVMNEYGDNVDSYTTENIVVGVNEMTGEEDWNKYGNFIPGDKLFFIKSSVTAPVNGDIIIYNSNNYKINKINEHNTGSISHYECYTSRV